MTKEKNYRIFRQIELVYDCRRPPSLVRMLKTHDTEVGSNAPKLFANRQNKSEEK